jgi:uncharacterized membrane protein YfcA
MALVGVSPALMKPTALALNVFVACIATMKFYRAGSASTYEVREASIPLLVVAGSALGFLSGLTGVGGGIFLSPLLLFMRWAPVKVISGVAAAFILVNSVAGMAGVMTTSTQFHPNLPILALVVMVGGYIGAEYGSRGLGNPMIQRLLALVLLVAGGKMIATA